MNATTAMAVRDRRALATDLLQQPASGSAFDSTGKHQPIHRHYRPELLDLEALADLLAELVDLPEPAAGAPCNSGHTTRSCDLP